MLSQFVQTSKCVRCGQQASALHLCAFALESHRSPLYTLLQRFSELTVVLANSMAALDRIFKILDAKPEIADLPARSKCKRSEARSSSTTFIFHTVSRVKERWCCLTLTLPSSQAKDCAGWPEWLGQGHAGQPDPTFLRCECGRGED